MKTSSQNPSPSTLNRGTLNLEVERHRKTRWGVDGKLYIGGQYVADTTEHPQSHLRPGTYPLTLNRMFLKRGNGPMLNTDGSICVGEHLCDGCVLRTREVFMHIYNRIQRALKRGNRVTLTIKSVIVMVTVMATMTSCSTAHQVRVVEHATHDTVYLNHVQYDSVYIFQSLQTDHLHDTVIIHDLQREYKYKLLRDTIRSVRIDSIPVIHTVKVTKTVKTVPAIYKWSLGILIVLIIIIVAIAVVRIIR